VSLTTKTSRRKQQLFVGFTTTKGALVRSMLFPKPIGFKFYRDSIRFIVVLSGIAGLGFCASAVQFIKLGVRALINHPYGGI
jgi:magnesium-transporting ATPase (P-type)